MRWRMAGKRQQPLYRHRPQRASQRTRSGETSSAFTLSLMGLGACVVSGAFEFMALVLALVVAWAWAQGLAQGWVRGVVLWQSLIQQS